MNRVARMMAVVALILPAVGWASSPAELTRVEDDYRAFNQVSQAHVSQPARISAMAAFYKAHFQSLQRPRELGRLQARDTAALFRATSDMAYYEPSAARVQDLTADVARLEQLKAVTPDQYRDVYGALYQTRLFPEMAVFATAHPDLGLPAPVASTHASDPSSHHGILEVIDEHTVRPQTVELTRATTIVVISNPGCHFTQYAIQAIENDPELMSMMSKHSVWIAPTDRNIDLAAFVAWNSIHPAGKIALVDSSAGWPEVGTWQTPIFIYFRDGKVVEKVVGWPKEGNAAAVKAAWRRAQGSS